MNEQLDSINNELKELIKKLGYTPSNAKKELAELQKKKEMYDQLKPIAEQYEQKMKELMELEKKLNGIRMKRKKLLRDIEKLGYDPKHHEEVKKKVDEIKKLRIT